MRTDEDLERIFTWREWRKVSQNLTLQYDKVVYLLQDCAAHRKLIGRTIEVAEYPDGRIELWADGAALPYSVFDPRETIRQADIVGAQATGARAGDCGAGAGVAGGSADGRPVQDAQWGAATAMKPTPGAKRKRQINRLDLDRAIAGSTAPPC